MNIDDFGKLAIQRYTQQVTTYNEQVNASKNTATIEDFQKHFIENDPRFDQFNSEIEALQSQIESIMTRRLTAATPLISEAYAEAVKSSGIDPNALDEALKSIKAGQRWLTSEYGEDALKDAPKIAGRKTASGGTAGEKGTPRVRGIEVYVDGILATVMDKNKVPRSNITAAVKLTGGNVQDLQKAFYEAAGMTDVKDEKFPESVEFVYNEHKVRADKVKKSDD